MHNFLTDSFVFLENLIVCFLHDFAVQSCQKRRFSVRLVISRLDGLDFRKKKMVVFLNVMELFYRMRKKVQFRASYFFFLA